MSDIVKSQSVTDSVLESLVTKGDISALTGSQKVQFYSQLCNRVGLDPGTTPFLPLKLNGKEILYATKGAAEQLRKIHCVSVTIVGRDKIEDVYQVTARAVMPDGRQDESVGAVAITGLKGEALANALMKAETKSKRRVTLSIIGLGMLDESELDTIPQDKFAQLKAEAPVTPAAIERPKERKAEALPPLPEFVTSIPAAILLASPGLTNASLDGVDISDMSQEQLELVCDVIGTMMDKASKGGKVSELGMSWMRAIYFAAEQRLQ